MNLENIFYFINKIKFIKKEDVEIFKIKILNINKNIKINIVKTKEDQKYLHIFHKKSGFSPILIKVI